MGSLLRIGDLTDNGALFKLSKQRRLRRRAEETVHGQQLSWRDTSVIYRCPALTGLPSRN